jgi:hypothetical protein
VKVKILSRSEVYLKALASVKQSCCLQGYRCNFPWINARCILSCNRAAGVP